MPNKDYNDKSGLAYYWLEENIGRVLLVALFAGIGLYGLLLEGRTELNLIQKLARGMGPELAGIVIAAVTIDALAERRQEAERKKILISQLGSERRDVTEMALIELRNRGWLYDGSLSGADLWRTDLSEAELLRADLSGAYLREANLSGVNLKEANLSGVNLKEANLSGAFLMWANLSGAVLLGANLSGADLFEVVLSGADLRWADLSGADLFQVMLSGADLSGVNLSKARSWEIARLEQVITLGRAIMPDEVQLGQEETKYHDRIEGPTFEEWKAQYLFKYGGTETDIRDKADIKW